MQSADPVLQWHMRFASGRDREFWQVNTRQIIEQMKSFDTLQLRARMKNYVYWIDFSNRHPAQIDARLFADFISDFARLAANLGESDGVGVVRALDQAIELTEREPSLTCHLYIAKARYYRTLTNDNSERHLAIAAAVANATPGTAEWGESMLELSGYYSDTSYYKKAVEIIAKLRSGLDQDLLFSKYECGARVREAAAMFGSFRKLSSIERLMNQTIEEYESCVACDEDITRWVAMAYYYLGRTAESKRRYMDSLSCYLRAIEIRKMGPEDLRVMGFFHLRIAELLTAIGQLAGARDHLDFASLLYRRCSNQSSGWLQACLGYAGLAATAGRYDEAIATAREAQAVARKMGYWRGELLSMGYLLALYIRQRNFRQLVRIVLAVAHSTELSRNRSMRLLVRMPLIVLKTMTQEKRHHRRVSEMTRVACNCSLHATEEIEEVR